jgi:hypothetical protein
LAALVPPRRVDAQVAAGPHEKFSGGIKGFSDWASSPVACRRSAPRQPVLCLLTTAISDQLKGVWMMLHRTRFRTFEAQDSIYLRLVTPYLKAVRK